MWPYMTDRMDKIRKTYYSHLLCPNNLGESVSSAHNANAQRHEVPVWWQWHLREPESQRNMSSSSFDAEFSSPSVLPPIRKSSSKAKNYNCPQEPSNEAFRLYVPFIESLSPKIVVRENSLGILGSVVVARAMICCCFFFFPVGAFRTKLSIPRIPIVTS